MEVNGKISEAREKVLKEAQGLFWRFGVKSVTMDDIAKHLGMSKKTLYQFFEDKDDIICQIIESFLKAKEQQIDEVRVSAKDPIHGLFLMTELMKSSFENMTASLMYELKKYHPRAYSIFIEHKKTCLLDCIITNLSEGVAAGVYRQDMDVKVIAKMRMEQVEIGFDQTIFPTSEYRLDEVQGQLFEHFIHGITTLKGHKMLNKYRQIEDE